jgi:hypothetical protein
VQDGRDGTTKIALRPSVRADGTMMSSFDPTPGCRCQTFDLTISGIGGSKTAVVCQQSLIS